MPLLTSLSEAGCVALNSLAAYPTRTTASGIANSPAVRSFAPDDVHEGLMELSGQHLATAQGGRWRLTPLGRELARSQIVTAAC